MTIVIPASAPRSAHCDSSDPHILSRWLGSSGEPPSPWTIEQFFAVLADLRIYQRKPLPRHLQSRHGAAVSGSSQSADRASHRNSECGLRPSRPDHRTSPIGCRGRATGRLAEVDASSFCDGIGKNGPSQLLRAISNPGRRIWIR